MGRACVVCLLFLFVLFVEGTQKPIIGVLTAGPTDPDCPTLFQVPVKIGKRELGNATAGCFTAFYVKWLEMAGARVVPVFYNAPKKQLDFLFESVNGILFTGGGLPLTPNTTYYQTANYLYQRTIKANQLGDYFPLWGTCMGFQLLNLLTADNQTVLCRYCFDSEDLSLPLQLTSTASQSRLFGNAPSDILQILTRENVTSNLHHDGVLPQEFLANPRLSSFFDLLSTNNDRKGRAFVSSMEAKKYPIYGVQWHPERPEFEWQDALNINHSANAIRAMQYIANFLVSEARKNTHTFPDVNSEQENLIYNWNPTYLGGSYQIYQFNSGV